LTIWKRSQAPGDDTVRKRVFFAITLLLFVIYRKEKHFGISDLVFFYVCLYANFQFSWWSREHFLAPFRGLYLPNACHRLLRL